MEQKETPEFEEHIKKVDEWGRKQYTPGSYTGSDMPFWVHGKNKRIKIISIVSLIIFAVAFIIAVYQGYKMYNIASDVDINTTLIQKGN